MDKVLIVDGFNLLWRAHFGFSSRIKNSSGIDITAPFGFFALLRSDAVKIAPELGIVVCFDGQFGSQDTQMTMPEYKANRPDDGPEVLRYLAHVKEGLEKIGVPWVEFSECEADQLIAGLASNFSSKSEVIIFSNDKDFYQLLDKNTKIWNGSGQKIIDVKEFSKKFGVLPSQWPEFVSLVGDRSDNISGIPGIGVVKAGKILREFGSIIDIIDDPKTNSELVNLIRLHREKFCLNVRAVKLTGNSKMAANLEAKKVKTRELQTAGTVINLIGLG